MRQMAEQKKEDKNSRIRNDVREIKRQMLTLLIGGLGLVAGLAWNDAVRSLFARVFPEGDGLAYKFGYAVLVTAVVVFLSIRLRKMAGEKGK